LASPKEDWASPKEEFHCRIWGDILIKNFPCGVFVKSLNNDVIRSFLCNAYFIE
jgi:hypothetical protein